MRTHRVNYFFQSCKKQTLEEIHRADMLAFKTCLRKEKAERQIYRNKFENVMSFLKAAEDHRNRQEDWPTFTEEEVETYTQDELESFSPLDRDREHVV